MSFTAEWLELRAPADAAARDPALRAAAAEHLGRDGVALDLGCGTGALAAAVIERCPQSTVLGIDFAATYVDYARGRVQGRIANADGTSRPAAIIEHADVRRMLLLQKAYAEGALALALYSARLLDEQLVGDEACAARASRLLDLLTPVVKAWPSEYGLAANDLAIQIHGGYGYTRDYDVEQLYRDNRLNPIHEGTTGIQALDLLGRKLLRDRGAALAELRALVSATVAAADADPAQARHAKQLDTAWKRVGEVVDTLLEADAAHVLDDATPFLWAFGHAVVAWLWLDMARLCTGDTPFHRGKRAAARCFFEYELPRVDAWLDQVAARSDLLVSTAPELFHS
ncbi:MAG TPA: acyl-CoA dehydrogenase C-terminal domain-containing protein [Gammaproteobacteria bacterium]|nr:acyl-CoA dehydrogenase C-terminal domain-containing protein [Gammaproteobacteria bacterium]